MGWETRSGGRRYLYRSVRVAGAVVREYLGSGGPGGDGQAAAKRWRAEQQARAEAARALADLRRRGAELAALVDGDGVRDAAGALMVLLGFRRHKRGGWRMFGGANQMRKRLEALEREVAARERKAAEAAAARKLWDQAPADDAEVVALFAAARNGDQAAVAKLPELIASRGWADWVGDVGRRATAGLVARVAPEPVAAAGLTARAAEMWRELAGVSPTTLEKLLARRVVNCWLAVHGYELELAVASELKARNLLEGMLAKAERRMATAARELAVVRRLEAPAMLARVEAAAGPRLALAGPTARPGTEPTLETSHA